MQGVEADMVKSTCVQLGKGSLELGQRQIQSKVLDLLLRSFECFEKNVHLAEVAVDGSASALIRRTLKDHLPAPEFHKSTTLWNPGDNLIGM